MIQICVVEYLEKSFQETLKCVNEISKYDLFNDEIIILKREPEGVGSLAKAINSIPFDRIEAEWVWIVTNITFDPLKLYRILLDYFFCFKNKEAAGLQPVYNSDHSFLNPNYNVWRTEVPYIEFTCPFVRTNILKEHTLDEEMPYWGHDLDWSYRLRNLDHKLWAMSQLEINHTYIRNTKNKEQITKQRELLRKKTNHSTRKKLIEKYGKNWKEVLRYSG